LAWLLTSAADADSATNFVMVVAVFFADFSLTRGFAGSMRRQAAVVAFSM